MIRKNTRHRIKTKEKSQLELLCGKLTLFFKKNKCPFYATNRVEWAFFDGGPEEIRTLDLSDANRTLSQLSYRPNSNCLMIITRSFFNCNTFFIFLCKSFFVRKNEKKAGSYGKISV